MQGISRGLTRARTYETADPQGLGPSSSAEGNCRRSIERGTPVSAAGSSAPPLARIMSAIDALLIRLECLIERLSGEKGSRTPDGAESSIPHELRDRDGFLWKPESDKNSNAVVLLPPRFARADVTAVSLETSDGTKLEDGVFSGDGNPVNGKDRVHIRFSKSGKDFPEDLRVALTLANGFVRYVTVEDPAKRLEGATNSSPAS